MGRMSVFGYGGVTGVSGSGWFGTGSGRMW